MAKRATLMCLVVAIAALAGQQAVAQSSQGGWEYTVAPFLIGAAMDGTVAVKGQDVDLDVPFSDIMANLHFAGMGYFAMKNDQWFLSGQLVYMNLKQSQDVANGTAEVTVEETIADVGYRASDLVTVFLGFRAFDVDYEDGSGTSLFRYDVLTSGPQFGVAFRF